MENLLANRRAVRRGSLRTAGAKPVTILCRKRPPRKSFDDPNSCAFPAPSARPQTGIPFRVGGVLHCVPIEVGRSVRPPHRAALAQFALDDIDGAMRGGFFG